MSLSILGRAKIVIVVAHLRGNLSINLGELGGTHLGIPFSALFFVLLFLILPLLILLLFVFFAAPGTIGAG